MRPRPDTNEDEVFVSDFALRKIDKGQFVELYYWTNDGLEETLSSQTTRDDEGLIPSEQDGSTVWVSAAAFKPSKHVVPNRFLPPADFAQAVLMLARFWGAITTHGYWNSSDLVAREFSCMTKYKKFRCD